MVISTALQQARTERADEIKFAEWRPAWRPALLVDRVRDKENVSKGRIGR
jgi:hypothetical protein